MPSTRRRKRLASRRYIETIRPQFQSTRRRSKKPRKSNARRRKEESNKSPTDPSQRFKVINPKKSKAVSFDFTDFTLYFSPDEPSNSSERSHGKVPSKNENPPKKIARAKEQHVTNASELSTRTTRSTGLQADSVESSTLQADSNRSSKRKFDEIEEDNISAQSAKKVPLSLNDSEGGKVEKSSLSAINDGTGILGISWGPESSSSKSFRKRLFWDGARTFLDEALPTKTSEPEEIFIEKEMFIEKQTFVKSKTSEVVKAKTSDVDKAKTSEVSLSKTNHEIQPVARRLSNSSAGSDDSKAASSSSSSGSSTNEIKNGQITSGFEGIPSKTETTDENPSSSESITEEKTKPTSVKHRACARKSTSKIRQNSNSSVSKTAPAKVSVLEVGVDADVTEIKNVSDFDEDDFLSQNICSLDDKSRNIRRRRTRRKPPCDCHPDAEHEHIVDSNKPAASVTNSSISVKRSPNLPLSDPSSVDVVSANSEDVSVDKKPKTSMGCIVYFGLGRPIHPAVYSNLKMQTSDDKIDRNWAKIAASAVQVPKRPPRISRFCVPIVYEQLEDLALKHFSMNCSRTCNTMKQNSSGTTVAKNDGMDDESNGDLEQGSDENKPLFSATSCCFHAGVRFLSDSSSIIKLGSKKSCLSKDTSLQAKAFKKAKKVHFDFEECTDSTSSCDTSSISKPETYSDFNELINRNFERIRNLGSLGADRLSNEKQHRQTKSELSETLSQNLQRRSRSADRLKSDSKRNNLPKAKVQKRSLRNKPTTAMSQFAIVPNFGKKSENGVKTKPLGLKTLTAKNSNSSRNTTSVDSVPSRISSSVPNKLFSSEKPYEFTIKMSKVGQKCYQSILSRKQTRMFDHTSYADNEESADLTNSENKPSLQSGSAQAVNKGKQSEKKKRRYAPLTLRALKILRKRAHETAKANRQEIIAQTETEVESVVQRMVNFVSDKELLDELEIVYDDDFCPSYDGASGMEERDFADDLLSDLIVRPSERKDRFARELARLNVNLIKLQDKVENDRNATGDSDFCSKESCKLGCACQTYNGKERNMEHCSQETCIFGCVCASDWIGVKSSSASPSILTPLMQNLQAKSSKKLAVKEFRETVFVSNDSTAKSKIFMTNSKRRNRKLPRRYEDHIVEVGNSFPSTVLADSVKSADDVDLRMLYGKSRRDNVRILLSGSLDSDPVGSPKKSPVISQVKSSAEISRSQDSNPSKLAEKPAVESTGIEDPYPWSSSTENSQSSFEDVFSSVLSQKSSGESSKMKNPSSGRFPVKSAAESSLEDTAAANLAKMSSLDKTGSESRIDESDHGAWSDSSAENSYVDSKQLLDSGVVSPRTLRVVLQSMKEKPKNIYCMVHNQRNCICLPQIRSKYSGSSATERTPGTYDSSLDGSTARTRFSASKFVLRNKKKSYLTYLLNQEYQRSVSLFFQVCYWVTPDYGEFQMQNMSLKQLVNFIQYCKKSLSYNPTLCDLLRASLKSSPNTLVVPPADSGILDARSYLRSSSKALEPESESGSSEMSTANPYFESDEMQGSIISNVCSIAPEEFEKLGKKEDQDTAVPNNLPEYTCPSYESSSEPVSNESDSVLQNVLIDLLPTFEDRHQWFVFDLLQDFEIVKLSIKLSNQTSSQRCLKRQLFDKLIKQAHLRNKVIRYALNDTIFSVFAVPGLPTLVFFGPFMRNDYVNLIPLKKSSPDSFEMVPLKEIFVKYKLPRTQTVYDFTLVHQEIKTTTEEMLERSGEPFVYYYFWEPMQNLAVTPATSSDVTPPELADGVLSEPVAKPSSESCSDVATSESNQLVSEVDAVSPAPFDEKLRKAVTKRKPRPRSKRRKSVKTLTPSDNNESETVGEEKYRHILRIEAEHSYGRAYTGENSESPAKSSSEKPGKSPIEKNSESRSIEPDEEPVLNAKSDQVSNREDLATGAEQYLGNSCTDKSNAEVTEVPQTLCESNTDNADPAPPGFVSKYLLCSVNEVGYVSVYVSTTSNTLTVNLSYMELNFDDVPQAAEWLNNTLAKYVIFIPIGFKPNWQLVEKTNLPTGCKLFDIQRLSKYVYLTEDGLIVKETENGGAADSEDTESTASASGDFEQDTGDVSDDNAKNVPEPRSETEEKQKEAQEPEEKQEKAQETGENQEGTQETKEKLEEAEIGDSLILDERTGLYSKPGAQSDDSLVRKSASDEPKESTACKASNQPKPVHQPVAEGNNHSQIGRSPKKVIKTKHPLSHGEVENTAQANNQPEKTCDDENEPSINNTDYVCVSPGGSVRPIVIEDSTADPPNFSNKPKVIDVMNPEDLDENCTDQEKSKSQVPTKPVTDDSSGKASNTTPGKLQIVKKIARLGDRLKTELKCTTKSSKSPQTADSSEPAVKENEPNAKAIAERLQSFRPILPSIFKDKMSIINLTASKSSKSEKPTEASESNNSTEPVTSGDAVTARKTNFITAILKSQSFSQATPTSSIKKSECNVASNENNSRTKLKPSILKSGCTKVASSDKLSSPSTLKILLLTPASIKPLIVKPASTNVGNGENSSQTTSIPPVVNSENNSQTTSKPSIVNLENSSQTTPKLSVVKSASANDGNNENSSPQATSKLPVANIENSSPQTASKPPVANIENSSPQTASKPPVVNIKNSSPQTTSKPSVQSASTSAGNSVNSSPQAASKPPVVNSKNSAPTTSKPTVIIREKSSLQTTTKTSVVKSASANVRNSENNSPTPKPSPVKPVFANDRNSKDNSFLRTPKPSPVKPVFANDRNSEESLSVKSSESTPSQENVENKVARSQPDSSVDRNSPATTVLSGTNGTSKVIVRTVQCVKPLMAASSSNATSVAATPQTSTSNMTKRLALPAALVPKIAASKSRVIRLSDLSEISLTTFETTPAKVSKPNPRVNNSDKTSVENPAENSPLRDSSKLKQLLMSDGCSAHTRSSSPPYDESEEQEFHVEPKRKQALPDPPIPPAKQASRIRKPRPPLPFPKPEFSTLAADRAQALQSALREVNRCSKERKTEEEMERKRRGIRKRKPRKPGKEIASTKLNMPSKKDEEEPVSAAMGYGREKKHRINSRRLEDPESEEEEDEEQEESSESNAQMKSSQEKLEKERSRRRHLFMLGQELLSVALENTYDMDYPTTSSVSLQSVLNLAKLAINKQKVESEMITMNYNLLKDKNTALRQKLHRLQNEDWPKKDGKFVMNPIIRTFVSETECIHNRLEKRTRRRNDKILKLAKEIYVLLEEDPNCQEWEEVKALYFRVPARFKTS